MYLTHELGNDAMERATLVSEALLAGAEGTEVLGRSRHHIGAKLHDDASGCLAANGHVEVALGVSHFVVVSEQAKHTLVRRTFKTLIFLGFSHSGISRQKGNDC